MCTIPRTRDWRSHLWLCSWFSNVYFRPSNGLPEPTGSLNVALKSQQGTSSPPCVRSAEYFLHPVTVHSLVPPRHKNSKHTRHLFSPWQLLSPYVLPDFTSALACLSLRACAAWKLIRLLQTLCCKIFMLKYFWRMSTLQNFSYWNVVFFFRFTVFMQWHHLIKGLWWAFVTSVHHFVVLKRIVVWKLVVACSCLSILRATDHIRCQA